MVSEILLFLFFSFFGWIIDSIYSTIDKKKLIISGYFRGLPFCPMYGIGGILIIISFRMFFQLNAIYTILLTTLIIIVFEFVSGKLAEYILEERLWDYRHLKYNIHGYVSLIHSVQWLIGIGILYFVLRQWLVDLPEYIKTLISFPLIVEDGIMVIFLLFVFWGTILMKRKRLGRNKR